MRWIAVLLIFLVACGGGEDEKILHLDGFDVSERTAQLTVRSELAKAGPQIFAACKQFSDMNAKEAMAYLESQRKGTPEAKETPPAGAKLKPGQVADATSKERSVAIFLAECKRLTGG